MSQPQSSTYVILYYHLDTSNNFKPNLPHIVTSQLVHDLLFVNHKILEHHTELNFIIYLKY